jgi:hypothetical protein
MQESSLPGVPLLTRGKVRDMYDLGDQLLIVVSDRISAFDVVLPTAIPGKGKEEAEVVMRSSRGPLNIWAMADYETVTDLDYTGDHAAKWETSLLWYLRPDLVDMSQLPADRNEKLWGVGGLDPRDHASQEVGREICEAIIDRVGQRALQMLAELD